MVDHLLLAPHSLHQVIGSQLFGVDRGGLLVELLFDALDGHLATKREALGTAAFASIEIVLSDFDAVLLDVAEKLLGENELILEVSLPFLQGNLVPADRVRHLLKIVVNGRSCWLSRWQWAQCISASSSRPSRLIWLVR